MLMTLNDIRAASAEQFALERQEAGGISETTPAALTPAIDSFARTLEAGDPEFVPVLSDPHGIYGWCSDGVLEKVKSDGGHCVFGDVTP